MVSAGEVFPEWYWGPIFFYFVFGLPLSAATQVADRDVLAYFDALRPIAPGDLDFKQG